ncbi:MAG: M14 family zinc carboxypeptidase [Bacteriovoracaceae bacterium]|nr:M14 family zinc carboxypeptidase [Bacteriovoracaceae bacterium]
MTYPKSLQELGALLELEKSSDGLVSIERLLILHHHGESYPVYGIVIGPKEGDVPTFGIYGGVHGLERIGSQITISYLQSIVAQMHWDKDLKEFFKTSRIVSIPMINPGGVAKLSRSNLRGVDLMRNAPVDAVNPISFFSGHRFSNWLPYYRGKEGEPMELENQTLEAFIYKYHFTSSYSVALDIHSGFGFRDQIWYPYAKSTENFPQEKEVLSMLKLFKETVPHHVYKIEPQSKNYVVNGDVWDYFFDKHYQSSERGNRIFLPLTLELGSWTWIKKNPFQIFGKTGLFNPIKKHRFSRTMRRHLLLLDFLRRVVKNYN